MATLLTSSAAKRSSSISLLLGRAAATNNSSLIINDSMRSFSEAPLQRRNPATAKKKAKKANQGDVQGGRPRDLQIILAALDAPVTKPPEVDAEEQARREQIYKNYTIQKFHEHNVENHDITCKIRIKQHAIKMLPRHSKLKEEALIITDDDGPPRWRNIPMWTPPIPGFDPENITLTEE